jgi:hypothetical protein
MYHALLFHEEEELFHKALRRRTYHYVEVLKDHRHHQHRRSERYDDKRGTPYLQRHAYCDADLQRELSELGGMK